MKLFKQPQPQPQPDAPERHEYDLAEVKQVAEQARRLAIYDRKTQLFAYWYLQLRATEEISRAHRHDKSVACLSIWAPTEPLIAAMCARLREGLRDHDLAAYLDNGHFVVLLTDTDTAGAELVLRRLLAEFEDVTAACSWFPADGATFDALLECAKARAAGASEEVA